MHSRLRLQSIEMCKLMVCMNSHSSEEVGTVMSFGHEYEHVMRGVVQISTTHRNTHGRAIEDICWHRH